MHPANGLILHLRNTARMLMGNLYWIQYWARKTGSDPRRDLAEVLPDGSRAVGKQGFNAWPMDVNQMLGWKRIKLPDDMPSIDGRNNPAIPEIRPICNILRRQTRYATREVFGDKDREKIREYDEADLDVIRDALNLPISSMWSGPVDNACYRPCYLMIIAPPLRALAEMLLDFTHLLVSNYGITGKRPVYGLHEHNPIAVCVHCDGLFLRERSNGKYCSVKCRSAAWIQRKGKKYFAEKQREYRAWLKAREERLKKTKSSALRRHRS